MIAEGFHVIGEVTMFSIIDQYCMENAEGKPLLERYGDIEVMQWTGYKNIYEGDIVKSSNGKMWEIVFHNYGWYISNKRIIDHGWNKFAGQESYSFSKYFSLCKSAKCDPFTEIGNIYQNHELLQTT